MNFEAFERDMAHQQEHQISQRGTDCAARLHNAYQMLEELGSGAYGRVTKAKHKISRSLFAIKHIDKKKAGSKGLREVLSEVETMILLSHPNIVHLQEVFEDDSNLWIVMDYVPGGELQRALKEKGRFDEHTVRRMAINLLLAVDYIHGKGIVHRDLKPANCLLSYEGDQELKIADFGFAVLVGENASLTSYCGTTAFMAPEILADMPYGKPVDMWAVGVILYLLLSGEYAFADREGSDIQHEIQTGHYSFNAPIWENISVGCKDLISKCLLLDQDKRISASDALKHFWIRAGMTSECDMFDFEGGSNYDGSTSHTRTQRTGKMMFRAGVYAVIAAHRLVYSAKCLALKREGSDLPLLRSYSFLVSRRYRPASNQISAPGLCYGNMRVVMHLVAMLEASDNVDTFDVSGNGIDSLDALQQIVRVSTHHPSLTMINLENNPIPPLAGRALLRLARGASKIRGINVNNTALGGDVIQQIAQSLKDMERKRSEGMSPISVPSSPATPQGGPRSRLASPSNSQSRLPQSGVSRHLPSRQSGSGTPSSHLPPIPGATVRRR